MFFFNKKSKGHTDFSLVGVDMHSHLIPGVDDGAQDVANSVELITGLKALGFTKLYTTPHTLQDIHPNTHETLKKGYGLLDGNLPEDITLHLSSEYYLDDQFKGQLEEKTVMPLPGNRLLIEFSQISRPLELEDTIFDLGIRGYQVVLAHPERYLFFHKNFAYFKRLKEMDVEFQVNALSLTKHYGDQVKLIAEKLIDSEYIDFIGTDLHHLQHLEALKKVPATKHFGRLIASGLLKNQDFL